MYSTSNVAFKLDHFHSCEENCTLLFSATSFHYMDYIMRMTHDAFVYSTSLQSNAFYFLLKETFFHLE